MSVSEPEPMSRGTALAYAIGLPLALLALVFGPVGRLDWPPGWVFIAFVVVAFAASALILWRINPIIYRARSRFQPGTKHWDKILLWLMLPAMVAEIPLATLDADGTVLDTWFPAPALGPDAPDLAADLEPLAGTDADRGVT
ncbi:MAG: hypothetical protein J0I75_28715, partial [Hyphomicrobium sp.]|nr:hypothetical protein [Hyphomicrobium sp.]